MVKMSSLLSHVAVLVALLGVGLTYLIVSTPPPRSDAGLKRAIADHYDILSPYYKKIWGVHLHHGLWRTGQETDHEATQNLVDELDKLGQVAKGSKILDVGCGYAGAAVYHASNMSCHVTGITVSKTQVEMAQQYAAERGVTDNTRFLVMDAEQIDFPGEDGTFDVVYTTEVLSHLVDKTKFFNHAARVLKPGGTLCLMDWFKAPDLTPQQEIEWVKPIEYGMLLPNLQTMDDYEAMATAVGFQQVYSEDISRPSEKTWHILTTPKTILEIAKNMLTEPALWSGLYTNGGEIIAFLKSFFDMKSGFDADAFRCGMQVYKLK
jgi:tocopherol O-methyltransferase